MKKILLGFGVVMLLAAGCNKTAQNNATGTQNQNTQQTNQGSQANEEFKFVTPKGSEKWKAGTTQTIAWTGGGKYYATSLTLHYTINAGPYAGQPGEQGIGTPKNRSGKNYDTFQWFISEDLWQTKGPYTISACLVDQMPGNAYSGCKSEKIISQAFQIQPKQPAQNNASGGLVYVNDRLGFQLTLTEAWQGYQAVDGGEGVRIEIPKYKVQNGSYSGNFFPITILTLPKEEYDGFVSHNDPGLPRFIAEKNGTVFTYFDWTTSPEMTANLPKDSSDKPINFEVSKVISTFKLTR